MENKIKYSYWRSQVLTTIKVYEFEDILFSDSIPQLESVDVDYVLLWHRKDHFLLSWMFSSISESMLGHVSVIIV